jgi:hypothetical protein
MMNHDDVSVGLSGGDSVEFATEIAGRIWCEDSTSNKVMDSDIALEFANVLAVWIDTAKEFARNAEYYRSLVVQCGEHIGHDAYVCDDGSVSNDVLCAKIPELVKELVGSSEN